MKIIVGEENIQEIKDKYTVLQLDTFSISGKLVKSYCLIEQVPIEELSLLQHHAELHRNLMINYDKRNWNFCEQAIAHLFGKWNQELDSFYDNLSQRIKTFKQNEMNDDWTPILDRSV